jgi:hypothetical protein
MEADQVDVVAFAVFGYFEQVENAEEAGSAGELRGDVGKADGLDGVDFDLAFFHLVALADGDAESDPDADAAGDFTAADAVSKAFGEDHGIGLLRRVKSWQSI